MFTGAVLQQLPHKGDEIAAYGAGVDVAAPTQTLGERLGEEFLFAVQRRWTEALPTPARRAIDSMLKDFQPFSPKRETAASAMRRSTSLSRGRPAVDLGSVTPL